MFKKIIFLVTILLSIVSILIFWPVEVFAYSSENTHPILGEQTAKLFNQIYGDWLSEQDIEWIKQGLVNEDQPPRWVNHFYDPTTEKGWNAERMGSVPKIIVKLLAFIGLAQQEPLSGLDWIHNQEIQGKYALYWGNRTFERAIFDYTDNNRQRAMQSLGHVLHLIQDMTVPAHTRQDTHADFAGDPGEPYEIWVKGKTNEQGISFLPSLEQISQNYQAVCQGVDECLIKSAQYSNQNFFSEDTILDSNYVFTKKIVYRFGYNGKLYACVDDEEGSEFYLFRIDVDEEGKRTDTVDDDIVLSDYWHRLSKQAILAGVETIKDFKEKAEDAINHPSEPPDDYKANPSSSFFDRLMQTAQELDAKIKTMVPIVSVYGEGYKAKNWWEKNQDDIDATLIKMNKFLIYANSKNLTGFTQFFGPLFEKPASAQDNPGGGKDEDQPPAAPAAPIVLSPENNSTVNQSPVLIQGLADAVGLKIFIQLNGAGAYLETIVDQNLTWQIELNLAGGQNQLLVWAQDSQGQESEKLAWQIFLNQTGITGIVVINEIAWMGTRASSADEWLELYNTSAQPINLTGWILSAENSSLQIVLSGFIEPGSYYLLECAHNQVISDIPADLIYTGALNNQGENLILKDNSGNIIDQVDFSGGWPEGNDNRKASMEKIRPELEGSSLDSWATNQSYYFSDLSNGRDANNQMIVGTPRAQNSYLRAGGTRLPIDFHISGTVVWSAKNSPYLMPFNMDDYVVVDVGAHLILEPGVVLKMGSYYLSLRIYGILEARGEVDKPIIFEPYDSGGWWSVVVFEPGSQGIFENVNFMSGGAEGFYHEAGGWSGQCITQTAVLVQEADVSFSECDFSDIQISALSLNNADALVQNCSFSEGQIQIEIRGGTPQIENNIFAGADAFYARALHISSGQAQILNNQFDGIGTIAFLQGGNPYFSGNSSQNTQRLDGILVDDQARFYDDASWQANFPYILEVNFRDQARVMPGASLTLEPGVIIKTFGGSVNGYESLIIEGSLIAQADILNSPIIMTSIYDDEIGGDTNCDGSATLPEPNFWRGLFFLNSSSGSILDGVIFRYSKYAIIKESDSIDLILGDIEYYFGG